jgi:ABC-type nitrate/sulfonate/bicarbonate transport system permease component
MEATQQESGYPSGNSRKSLEAAWEHACDLWRSDTGSAAWASFKSLLGTMPAWALAALFVAVFGLASNSFLALFLAGAGGFLATMFVTVKHAIRSALREHELKQRR